MLDCGAKTLGRWDRTAQGRSFKQKHSKKLVTNLHFFSTSAHYIAGTFTPQAGYATIMVIGLGSSLGQICRLLGLAGVRDQSDAQLLGRFLQQRDQTAFAGLLERHGPMVWNVCRRVLLRIRMLKMHFRLPFWC